MCVEMISMPVRTFKITFMFWFIVATVNGFTGGMAVCWMLHYLRVWA